MHVYWSGEMLRFLTEIAVYLVNGARWPLKQTLRQIYHVLHFVFWNRC